MYLDLTKYENPKGGAVHLCLPRARQTLCGIDKVHWPYAGGLAWVDCDTCHYAAMGLASELMQEQSRPVEAAAQRIAAA